MGQVIEDNLDKIQCPNCDGRGIIECRGESVKDILGVGTMICSICKGTGKIQKNSQIQDLLFEAFASDSVSLRQKCIWKYTILELRKAVLNQIKGFEDSINEGKEEVYIIEEYKDHLERFKEWSRYLLLEAQSLRSNSTDPSVMYQGV